MGLYNVGVGSDTLKIQYRKDLRDSWWEGRKVGVK